MKNRTKNKKFKKDSKDLNTFFLACEFKPHSPLFSVLDPFAYDVQPAFIFGSLGIISYNPISYAIIDIDEHADPLLGYLLTITEPDTVTLLDKLKGCLGKEAFNTHNKKIIEAYTDIDEHQEAWVYQLSEYVLENYEQIEQIEYGIFDEDDILLDLLERIGENYEN